MSTRILVVTDDAGLRARLSTALTDGAFEVRSVSSGAAALDAVDLFRPDVVLLSLDLKSRGGITLCERLRAAMRIPIVALSRQSAERSKVAALDAGADDYVVLPFSPGELLARIRVAVRHRRALASIIDDEVVEVGDLRIDPSEHRAVVGRRALSLTPKEFQLLELLARNAGKVVAHETLLELIWPGTSSADTLRLHVSQLRKKLGGGERTPVLVTEPGVGYSLALPDAAR